MYFVNIVTKLNSVNQRILNQSQKVQLKYISL